jgi:hypothetical protein
VERPDVILRERGLFRVGAFCACAIVLIYLFEIILVIVKGFPPSTMAEWLGILQASRSVGILRTFAPDIIAIALKAPLYIALFFLLRKAERGYPSLVISVALAFIGMAVYFATNVTFSMLSVSDQLASVTSEAQKSQLLAAGQALMSIYNGTGPFVAFAFFSIAGILLSIVMLHSGMFGRTAAILGIAGNALELGLPPAIDPPFFLKVDPVLIAVGGVLIIAWYLFIIIRLIQRARQ